MPARSMPAFGVQDQANSAFAHFGEKLVHVLLMMLRLIEEVKPLAKLVRISLRKRPVLSGTGSLVACLIVDSVGKAALRDATALTVQSQ